MSEVRIEESWKHALSDQFSQAYWHELTEFVRTEYKEKKVFPPPKDIFRAFELCPFDAVKVVIVGQDPYHGSNQANGLSFAVHKGVSIPPSLKNIFKEIKDDTGVTPLTSGDLSRWAKQGVLLLNSVLTVRAHAPASHKGKGWEVFTDAAIAALNAQREHIVYLLWGKYAQEKGAVINKDTNLVLSSGHPSPYSVQLFFGHHHFSTCNFYLEQHDTKPIDWK